MQATLEQLKIAQSDKESTVLTNKQISIKTEYMQKEMQTKILKGVDQISFWQNSQKKEKALKEDLETESTVNTGKIDMLKEEIRALQSKNDEHLMSAQKANDQNDVLEVEIKMLKKAL